MRIRRLIMNVPGRIRRENSSRSNLREAKTKPPAHRPALGSSAAVRFLISVVWKTKSVLFSGRTRRQLAEQAEQRRCRLLIG
jgi:hypothetical protein